MADQSEMLEQVQEQAQVAAPQPPEAEEAVGLIVSKLEGWGDTAVELLPNLAVALLALLAFWIVSKIARKALRVGLRKTPLAVPLRNLFVTALGLAMMAAGLFIALAVMGLDKTVVSLLAGVGILGLALGFAFQDIAANFIAGVVISVRQPIHVGDVIETSDYFGTVDEINLRSTIVRTPTGQIVFIPSKQVFESPIVNFSKPGKRRVDLKVGSPTATI
jgi:small-conductance mechanosensitive channel